jgi:hypothetical protein
MRPSSFETGGLLPFPWESNQIAGIVFRAASFLLKNTGQFLIPTEM